jgi:gluconolactonase
MSAVAPSPYDTLDERFAVCQGDVALARLYSGCRWAEGPVYVAAGRYLLFSDIPDDRILRWDEPTGVTGVFRQPSAHANGHTLDCAGRLVTCEHGARRVTRTELDGSITVLADRFEGRRFNSPNDVVVARDGSVWFTDPSYGIDSDYEGHRAASEIGACNVYRLAAGSGECRKVADGFERPNGLALSPDERLLYVSDSAAKLMRRFSVGDGGALSGEAIFATCTNGSFDGLRVDEAGRVWVSAGDGVHCYDPDGTLIGKILVPEVVANLVFGGAKLNRLFITASTSLYSIHLSINGVPPPYGRAFATRAGI